MQRPWPLAKVDGFILVWESLTGVISVRLLRSIYVRGFFWTQIKGTDIILLQAEVRGGLDIVYYIYTALC
jgi:hypothetical protein